MPDAAVVLYRRGRSWRDGVALAEQAGLREHIAFLTDLCQRGIVEQAGPFTRMEASVDDELVGLGVFSSDAAAAAKIVRRDPAVVAETLAADVRPWYR